ncbi:MULTISPECIES: phytoene desaturase family protein [Asaia]|uniref:phytoene desaturase family protein n=1 Tax=Asaia TaxID=91914 RepID=UPI002FC290D3
MTSSSAPIIIIGSGLGGLAAACTLSARGHKVIVCEANDWTGGKAAEWRQDGFRFDMGPTILTLPSVLKRIFGESGLRIDERLDLRRLDPQWRCFFDDGTPLDLVEDVTRMAAELEKRHEGDGKGYEDLLAVSEKLHDISRRFVFWKSVGGLRDTLKIGEALSPTTMRDVLALRMHATLGAEIRKRIANPQAVQVFDHFTQYVGSNPLQAPAVLTGIAHMQVDEGIWYPMGGTRAVPQALRRLAEENGVEFRTNRRVSRIVHDEHRVSGVVTEDGETLKASAVISNMDSVRTMRELIDRKVAPQAYRRFMRQWKHREPACSGVVLYLGLDRGYDHLAHHNFVFSRDAEEEFDAIYKYGRPAPDPTCYLAATARTDPDTAPPGGEALYVLVHTPYLRPGQNWTQMFPGYRQVILDKLKKAGGMPDLESRIVTEHHLTPMDIHLRYSPQAGAIYGLASHGRLEGGFKPANRSRDLAGLYLAGGSAHPGPGMPMALMSGWIAADCLDQDRQASRDPALALAV